MSDKPPAGWYTDGQGGQRWWDGDKWFEAVEPGRPLEEPTRQQVSAAEGADAEAGTEVDSLSANTERSSRRAPSRFRRYLTGRRSLLIYLGALGTLYAAVALLMVDPTCLDSCGDFNKSVWELFGLPIALLVLSVLVLLAGVRVARRQAVSATFRSESTSKGRPSVEGGVSSIQRKKVWIPLLAILSLALAGGVWAVVATAGPSDEEKQLSAEKRESAAAAEAEQQAEAELAQQKATCESTISEFEEAVEAVDSKLNVGLVQNDFNSALGDASVAHNKIESDSISSDEYCLSKVAGPLEDAFNIYVRSNTKWNKCIQNYNCEVKGAVLKDMQTKWTKASVKILLADAALENYGSPTSS